MTLTSVPTSNDSDNALWDLAYVMREFKVTLRAQPGITRLEANWAVGRLGNARDLRIASLVNAEDIPIPSRRDGACICIFSVFHNSSA